MYAFTLGSFVFFTVLVAFITWLITRRDKHDTSDGYFLGGRVLTGGYIAGSLLLTNLSTEQLVGLNGSCLSGWFKRDGLGSDCRVFSGGDGSLFFASLSEKRNHDHSPVSGNAF